MFRNVWIRIYVAGYFGVVVVLQGSNSHGKNIVVSLCINDCPIYKVQDESSTLIRIINAIISIVFDSELS